MYLRRLEGGQTPKEASIVILCFKKQDLSELQVPGSRGRSGKWSNPSVSQMSKMRHREGKRLVEDHKEISLATGFSPCLYINPRKDSYWLFWDHMLILVPITVARGQL